MVLMIAVLVVIIVMTYNAAQKNKMFPSAKHGLEEAFKDEGNLLSIRVAAIIHTMYELTVNPIVNKGDVNTMYHVWYSTMNKRGVPPSYTTPDLFTKLHEQSVRGDLSPESVEAAILPYFRSEVAMLRNPRESKPFQPVCLNY